MSTSPSGGGPRYIPTLTEVIGRPGQGAATDRLPQAGSTPAAVPAGRPGEVAESFHTPPDAPFLGDPVATGDGAMPAGAAPEAAGAVLADADIHEVAERIAANARARLEMALEGHIQRDILPLVDAFAEQLVTRLHADLAHSLRDAVASATSEELERLRGLGRVPRRS